MYVHADVTASTFALTIDRTWRNFCKLPEEVANRKQVYLRHTVMNIFYDGPFDAVKFDRMEHRGPAMLQTRKT